MALTPHEKYLKRYRLRTHMSIRKRAREMSEKRKSPRPGDKFQEPPVPVSGPVELPAGRKWKTTVEEIAAEKPKSRKRSPAALAHFEAVLNATLFGHNKRRKA